MIVYVSKHGAVRDFVTAVAERSEQTLVDLRSTGARGGAGKTEELLADRPEEPIVIAAPIYAGQLPKAVRTFMDHHRETLLQRRVALILSCLYAGEEARIQMNEVFPPWITGHADREFLIGGRVRMGELSGPVRFLIKRILGHGDDVDSLDWDQADEVVRWYRG